MIENKKTVVERLLQDGRSPVDIATMAGCGLGYVYKVKRMLVDPERVRQQERAAHARYDRRDPAARLSAWAAANPEKIKEARKKNNRLYKHRRRRREIAEAYQMAWLSLGNAEG